MQEYKIIKVPTIASNRLQISTYHRTIFLLSDKIRNFSNIFSKKNPNRIYLFIDNSDYIFKHNIR